MLFFHFFPLNWKVVKSYDSTSSTHYKKQVFHQKTWNYFWATDGDSCSSVSGSDVGQ